MAVVILSRLIEKEQLNKVKEEYGSYVKFVADINREVLAAGGEWHADAEKYLIDNGSNQEDLWGGGINLDNDEIDYVSLINTRPNFNNSQEVSNPELRRKIETLVKKIFGV